MPVFMTVIVTLAVPLAGVVCGLSSIVVARLEAVFALLSVVVGLFSLI